MLTGLRVLDLSDQKASFCSKLLADLQATVVKVESPWGDPSRRIGPFLGNQPHPDGSLFFCYHNTNKLGITLDLETPQGRDRFRRLAGGADVVVETFPPDYLEQLKLGYQCLSRVNPGLILVSVTGFGRSGPHRHYKSSDIIASATGGQMHVCGARDTPPLKPHGEQSYYAASLFAAAGVLVALRERRRSGRGQHVDVSTQEAVAATLEHVLVRYFYDGVVPGREGPLQADGSVCLLPCKDGYLLVLPGLSWDILADWLDSEGMAGDLKEERWRREEYRRHHARHVVDILSRWTRLHTRAELYELAQLMRLPWAPVASPEEMVNSPQLSSRGFFTTVEHPEQGQSYVYPGRPYRLSTHPPRTTRAPAAAGSNDDILPDWPETVPGVTTDSGTLHPQSAALHGVRVLDFTRILAGPYATRLLADFGAEVIKVQSRETATGAETNSTGYFNTWNRNKLGITLNMAHPRARHLALRLVELSDVVLENYSPRVKSNWGMDYDRLREVNPSLVMVSMSGMGQTGPWKDFVALGSTIQAFSGMTYLSSFPSAPPLGLGYSYADPVAGLYAVLTILAALEQRANTGRGQYIDISEYEAMCSLLGPAILDYTVNRKPAAPLGNRPGYIRAAPYGCYRCRGDNRWCVIAVSSEDEWRSLCRTLGSPPWTRQHRFSSLLKRMEHAEELDSLLQDWTAARSPEVVMTELQQAGVPAGAVQDAGDLASDLHLAARAFFIQAEHPDLGTTVSDATPIKLSRTPARYERVAPLLGQHNAYIYCELLGMTEEELADYVNEGMV